MPYMLSDEIISWLNETGPSTNDLDISMVVALISIRLRERNYQEDDVKNILRIIAPLDFFHSPPHTDAWNSYFAPQRKASEGQPEYPAFADFNADTVNEWARLSLSTKRPIVRARFADSVWELGRRLGSQRKDLYKFARLANEMYVEATRNTVLPQHSWELFQTLSRSTRLALRLRTSDLVDQSFDLMMMHANSAPLEHIGLWAQPFELLVELKALGEAKRSLILERYETRLRETVRSSDLFRIMMTGWPLAKHYYDHRDYDKAREITTLYGEAVLGICSTSNDPGIAVKHIGDILETYRRIGLRDEAEKVRLFLEEKGKEAAAAMKSRRFEFKFDEEEIDKTLIRMFDAPDAFAALYRLAAWCSPSVRQIVDRLEGGDFIAHMLVPTVVVGMNGLAIKNIGTYDRDKEGQIVLAAAQEMNLSCGILIRGMEQWKRKFNLGGIPDTPKLLDSILIPADRIGLLQEGVSAFESEDYVKSIHVLIPQVENCLREILKVLNISTSKTDEDGGYELKNINDVLHEPIVQESLEEDLWYFLKALYSDKRGMNLRNLVAHGIAPAQSFNRGTAALVVQSIVFLSALRPDAISVSMDQDSL